MAWYLVIFTTLFFLALLSLLGHYGNEPIIRYIPTVISLAILLFFMGFRSISVGADTEVYEYGFLKIGDTKWSDLFGQIRLYNTSINFEYGYRLYNKILFLFNQNGQTITFMNSAIIIILLGLIIFRASIYPFLSLWLYVTLGTFQTQMNMARNAVAIFICYLGICSILPNRISRWRVTLYRRMNKQPALLAIMGLAPSRFKRALPVCLLFILLGATFHASSLLLLAFCVVAYKVKLTPKNVKIWTFFAFVAGITIGYLLVLPSSVFQLIPVYGTYLYNSSQETLSARLILGIFHLFLVCFVLCLTDKRQRRLIIEKEPMGVWMLLAELFSFSATVFLPHMARVAALFGPYLMISIPNMLFWGIRSKRKRFLAMIALILLTGTQYVLRLMINNIGYTLPYTFFWM